MTYISAGTYVMKSLSGTTRSIVVDGEDFFLIGAMYHLVIVNEYASYDNTLVDTIKVPNGTISISYP